MEKKAPQYMSFDITSVNSCKYGITITQNITSITLYENLQSAVLFHTRGEFFKYKTNINGEVDLTNFEVRVLWDHKNVLYI